MGLLTPGAFGKSPLDKKPKKIGKGLLTPVVAFKGLRTGTPTDRPGEEMLEGGGIGPRGGGGSRVGHGRGSDKDYRITTYPKEGDWTPRFQNLIPRHRDDPVGRPRDQYTVVETPSGQTVRFDQYTSGNTSVTFSPTSYAGGPQGPQGMKVTGDTFGHVMRAMRDYARLYKPKSLKYYGATDAHQRLYDRASPQLAKGLGAKHSRDGRYHILEFPEGWDK